MLAKLAAATTVYGALNAMRAAVTPAYTEAGMPVHGTACRANLNELSAAASGHSEGHDLRVLGKRVYSPTTAPSHSCTAHSAVRERLADQSSPIELYSELSYSSYCVLQ